MQQTNLPEKKPRIPLDAFENWLVQQEPGWLLTPKAYLFCVDGCRPDEVSQRFGMVESISQRAGRTDEEIAHWHKTYGEMYDSDPEVFAIGVYAWDRREKASLTVLQFMCDIKPKKAEYLIKPYLPKGMLTVLGGVSGVGKTWLALHWAAQVSNSFAPEEPGAVYYFTQENDPAIVLRNRVWRHWTPTTRGLQFNVLTSILRGLRWTTRAWRPPRAPCRLVL